MTNQKRWAYVPETKSNLKISSITKSVIKQKADDFIETYLKPNFIQPPPTNKNLNYIVVNHHTPSAAPREPKLF